jgi:hypothetical protein
VRINPEQNDYSVTVSKSLARAQANMDYESIFGHVSQMTLCEPPSTITSLDIESHLESHIWTVQPDLLIYVHNEHMLEKATIVRDSMTASIDEKQPVNGVVWDRDIIPLNSRELSIWITEPWTFSLNDDTELKTKI